MAQALGFVSSPVEPKPPSARPLSSSVALDEGDAGDGRDDELCNAHAPRDRERLAPEIDQEHLHLAAVVGVDRAGRVEHGDAVAGGEAGARPHLRLEAIRQLDDEPGRHEGAPAWLQDEGRIVRNRRQEIETGGAGGLVARQRQIVRRAPAAGREG